MGRLIITMALGIGIVYGARPMATDDVGTVERGSHELEVGCDFWSDWADVSIGFKHGLSERMDVGVGLGITITPDQPERFSVSELGLKFVIIPDFFATSVTGIFGETAYSLNGIITRVFEPIEIDLNLGYDATGKSTEEGSVTYAGGLILGLDMFDLGVEVSGDKEGFNTWLFGGRYYLMEGLALDAGILGGFEEDSEFAATGGIHFEF